MAKKQDSIVENVIDSTIELDSSVNIEILIDTEHLKKGQKHSVSYAIAQIFINQKIAKIIE